MACNQMLQTTIEGVKGIARTDLCLMNTDGSIAASTIEGADQFTDPVLKFIQSPAEIQVVQGYQYFKIFDGGSLEYVLLMRGDTDDLYTIGKLVAFQIQNLLSAYKDRYDKENFIKNILLDNMLLVDIYNKAKKLHIDVESRRCVIIIETKRSRDNAAMEIVRGLIAGRSRDFLTAVSEDNMILVREVGRQEDYAKLHQLCTTIVDVLNTEAMANARVSYGTIISSLKDLSRSYKEAQMALDVGKIFYQEQHVAAYNRLGIGRLIYQLPVPLCRMFIEEIFPDTSPDELDDETLVSIRKFFENSLNVSETARQLYIHRNTLVYRLEKVSKATGLDLRSFDDAIIFEIAMMVVRYMRYLEDKETF